MPLQAPAKVSALELRGDLRKRGRAFSSTTEVARTEAAEIAREIVNHGGSSAIHGGDLTDPADGSALIKKAVDELGGLDILINNAGIFPNSPLERLVLSDWRKMYSANVETTYICTQAAAEHMKHNGGGSIVNLASVSALNPGCDHSHYNSAKAAVVMFTRSAAQELGPLGIRVNAVSPGLIGRPGIERQWPDGVARWKKAAPLERLGDPVDVADACLFLTSPAANWITGHNLIVDGGVLCNMIY